VCTDDITDHAYQIWTRVPSPAILHVVLAHVYGSRVGCELAQQVRSVACPQALLAVSVICTKACHA